ncbi:2-amino-4-hydroxy-6-hydroxymethyldihydropteridine diphosphokinase [Nesterenkonia halotolerans]|uniref:Bifunctional folate synthesis protein n=1 Tax=Nesterenkonia halotolerans TaxID=225325 RepID=A0ABR9J740_9MICC|nr:2-amino-4-hydroxy-6-hydroxymethyldihydropteridine diphosphokinase [Nesterenkonia halotolerans]MBE1514815.1 dihydroneopterin aldolase/2-amino-4-hydroxy-6-hydroxymethyldihydropteridine diphosphokinase [Nesterenkonia halotolerans]
MPSRSDLSDTIRLTGLTATGHHGVFDFEKREGQPFRVDAELTLDFRAAGRSDELQDTVSYVEIAELIEAAITGEPFDLIEALADHLAREILRSDARLLAAEITVHKPQAPLPQSFQDVSVTARRTRADLSPRSVGEDARTSEDAEASAGVGAPEGAATTDAEVRAVLALGSNLGDSTATLASAVTSLRSRAGLRVLAASPLARTRPVGGPPDQPDFLNQVIEVATTKSPQELLALTQQVEAEHHRARGAENGEIHWGPRTLDIDIITYGSARVSTPALQIPHPRAAQRGFVLVPWTWMDPQATLGGVFVAELAAQAADSATVELAEEHLNTGVRP